MTTKKDKVAIIMGSKSDWKIMQHAVETLKDFGVPSDVRIMSAHRTPDEAKTYAVGAKKAGVKVIIAAAGMAAHLAGSFAAHSTLPVIGVPLKGGAMEGLDSLLATVQMPAGVPVATVALGRAGAINAALLSVQILSLSDTTLARKFQHFRRNQSRKVLQADEALQKELTTNKKQE